MPSEVSGDRLNTPSKTCIYSKGLLTNKLFNLVGWASCPPLTTKQPHIISLSVCTLAFYLLTVLDTKYKAPEQAGYTDIHQMISYANTTKCKQAFLIYPKDLTQPLDIKSDQIRVRSLTFSLDDNLDRAGQTFLKNLFLFS